MGCVCSHEEGRNEFKSEFHPKKYEIEEIINSNPELLNALIKIQAIIKGRYYRKYFKKESMISMDEKDLNRYTFVNTDKITQQDLQDLFNLEPPLDD